MKLQTWEKALLTGTVLALLAATACQSSETKSYARQLNLPKEVSTAVSQLDYDANTRALLDELSHLPKDLQTHEITLNYLEEVSKDKAVSYDEVSGIRKLDHDGDGLNLEEENELKTDPLQPNPGIKKVFDYLESVSDETLAMYKRLGIDGDVVSYISLVSTLPKDFADYAVKSRLCIQDKKLTEEEEKFLQDPNKYLQKMYEYNISEIATIDPELAIKLKQMPFLQDGVELKDVESLEDILYLASNPQNKSKLEKIYGKGIERKMWPVALERVFYKGFENEFDINSPFEGSEWYLNSGLAEFQEKYNTEMDQAGVPGPKPKILGMNILHEPLGNQMEDNNGKPKTEDDLKFDYALIRWILRCNAVRLNYGMNPDVCLYHVKLARNEGLEPWLLYWPLFQYPYNTWTDWRILDDYKKGLEEFSKKCQENNILGIWVGGEFDAWWPIWGGYDGTPTKYDLYSGEIRKYIDELANIVRQNYTGPISYQEWDYWNKTDRNVNWKNMDNISLAPYVGDYNSQFLNDELYVDTFGNIKTKYDKPLFIVELGSQTITESEMMGGAIKKFIDENQIHYDQEKQAKTIDRYLRLLYKVGVDAIFIFSWDEPIDHPWCDMNKFGSGIWDCGTGEPKQGFFTVYKYFRE